MYLTKPRNIQDSWDPNEDWRKKHFKMHKSLLCCTQAIGTCSVFVVFLNCVVGFFVVVVFVLQWLKINSRVCLQKKNKKLKLMEGQKRGELCNLDIDT